jgi:hypothetical protein
MGEVFETAGGEGIERIMNTMARSMDSEAAAKDR